jgi:glycogen(starch) synthase
MLVMLDGSRASFHEAAIPLLARRHDVELVVLGGSGPLDVGLARRGIKTVALQVDPVRRPLAARRAVRAHIQARQPDVVHAHEALPAMLAFGGLRRRGSAAMVYHRHHAERGSALHTVASRLAARGADVVVAVSEHGARCARQHDRPRRADVVVAHNGVTAPVVEDGAVERLRSSLALRGDAAVVVSVGRLRAEKGFDDLIGSLEALQPQIRRPVEVIVVGDGPRRIALEAAGLPDGFRLHLVGEQDGVGPYYAVADVVVVPSRREAFGLTAVEAMSLARPVVATAVGGLCETIVDRESGLLVEPGSTRAMADGIAALLIDPARGSQLGLRGEDRQRARFTTEAMVERWCAIYEAAASSRLRNT